MKINISISTLMIALIISNCHVLAKENIAPTSLSNKSIAPRIIEWTDLMPEEDLKILESMTPIDHDTLSKQELAQDKTPKRNSLRPSNATSKFENSISTKTSSTNNPKKRTYEDVLNSYEVRPEFNNKKIKIAGFIVPIDYKGKNWVTSFFLVPYFGACIHVPPPPPNQIIYVRIPKGIKITEIYNPFWVTGSLRIETTEKENGASAYSLDAETITEYKEP